MVLVVSSSGFDCALRLWTTVAPYRDRKAATIAWRLVPADRHNRIRHYWDGSRYMGFVTWAWFTEREFETNDYSGPDVFARDSGEVLKIVDMIAPFGRRDVFRIAKDIRSHLSVLYPDTKFGLSHRRGRTGKYGRRS